jgi:hypothetical protein
MLERSDSELPWPSSLAIVSFLGPGGGKVLQPKFFHCHGEMQW